jgi:3-methylfumaryl-CoA hydratase
MEVETVHVGGNSWKEWIGRTRTAADWVTPSRVAAWHATLDHATDPPHDGDPAPLGFHWTLAPLLARESELGPPAHPPRGGFLPPIPLQRRLWAGSRVVFHRPLRVGERVERESTITAIDEKQGKGSALIFVTVHHRFVSADGVTVDEDQDLVYREPPAPSARTTEAVIDARGADGAEWHRTIHPTETLLFRYSALTFNGHRIHYDRRYATGMEGYAGLVVHGPLIATLLLELIQTRVPAEGIERFQFKAIRPTFDTSDFSVCGAPTADGDHFKLWSTDNHGARAVEADAWMRR